MAIPMAKIKIAKALFKENMDLNINILRGLVNDNGRCYIMECSYGRCYIMECSYCVVHTVNTTAVCTSKSAYKIAKFLLENNVFENLESEGSNEEAGTYDSIWEK